MKKAKTIKNLIPFLSALLGVVFAFITSFTFAAGGTTFVYETHPKSTSAYLANSQHVVVNNTINSPMVYSVGVHPVNIALQYAIDYEFDLRIHYSLDWLGDDGSELSTNNVRLIFANRDNVIVDNEYIYYINYESVNDANQPCGLTAGEGNLSLIAGVEIIETENSDYFGKRLQIKIDEVKYTKTLDEYEENQHILFNDASEEGSKAAEAWMQHKLSGSLTNEAYVMVYNYRATLENGVQYPGYESAYSKYQKDTVATSWIGGNRAYAGVGLYIITGSTPIKITAKVTGSWELNPNNEGEDPGLLFDNSIRFNYTKNWSFLDYNEDANLLFSRNYYNYVIPANTACYIEVLDSVEVTTAGMITDNTKGAYLLVIADINVNGEIFSGSYISTGTITSSTAVTAELSDYSKENITIINTSKYANEIYEYSYGSVQGSAQTYKSSTIALVNNTNTEQVILLGYNLNYYFSNGSSQLTLVNNGIKSRATNFTDLAYYRLDQSLTDDSSFIEPDSKKYIVPAYSSVRIDSSFELGASFQTKLTKQTNIVTKTDNGNTVTTLTAGFDAWLELEPVEVQTVSNNSQTTENLSVGITSKMVNVGGVQKNMATVMVKNNTDLVYKTLTVNINIYDYVLSISSNAATKPADFSASYWKYYIGDSKIHNTSAEWNNNLVYYLGVKEYSKVTPSVVKGIDDNHISYESNVYSNTDLILKPNESISILTFELNTSAELTMQASATGTTIPLQTWLNQDEDSDGVLDNDEDGIILFNQSLSQNYIVNYSNKSYFVRFDGDISAEEEVTNVLSTADWNYYTFIIRPGQIVNISSAVENIEVIQAPSLYEDDVTLAGWEQDIIDLFNSYFS